MNDDALNTFDPETVASIVACTLEVWSDGEIDLVAAYDTIFEAIEDVPELNFELLVEVLQRVRNSVDEADRPATGIWN